MFHHSLLDFYSDALGIQDRHLGIRDRDMGINCKFGLETVCQRRQSKGDGTHVKDKKDPVEVQSPGSNRISVVLRMENARYSTSLTYLADVPLDFRHSPAASGGMVSRSGTTYIPMARLTSSVVQSPQTQTD